ncbi:MAG: hypothetical protein ACLU6O_02065 [Bilophila wadsworthia]
MNERLGEGRSEEGPSPNPPLSHPKDFRLVGEADQQEFLPDNSFLESNTAESLIFSPYFLK